MKIYNAFNELDTKDERVVFSLGCYDGVHKGHQHILSSLITKAREEKALSCILTFSNHPSWVLDPSKPKKLLCSGFHKHLLLERLGLDMMIEIPFSKELSLLGPEDFFGLIKEHLNITSCVFGEDTCIGKDRVGTTRVIEEIGQKEKISISCLSRIDNFSSTQIRHYLEEGNLKQVESYLGRPFSIMQKPVSGKGMGKGIGYPTINLPVDHLCLPPLGVYITSCQVEDKSIPAISNLGYAPTLGGSKEVFLETHLLDQSLDEVPDILEVTLHQFLRPEFTFSDKDELRSQIQKDIEKASAYFSASC